MRKTKIFRESPWVSVRHPWKNQELSEYSTSIHEHSWSIVWKSKNVCENPWASVRRPWKDQIFSVKVHEHPWGIHVELEKGTWMSVRFHDVSVSKSNFSQIPHRHSWTFTDNFFFSQIPHGCSRTFTNEFWFFHKSLTKAPGLPQTIFDLLIYSSWTLTDFHGQFFIFWWITHVRSRTFRDNFWFFHRCLTDACGNSWKIFDFFTDALRTLTDFHEWFVIFS